MTAFRRKVGASFSRLSFCGPAAHHPTDCLRASDARKPPPAEGPETDGTRGDQNDGGGLRYHLGRMKREQVSMRRRRALEERAGSIRREPGDRMGQDITNVKSTGVVKRQAHRCVEARADEDRTDSVRCVPHDVIGEGVGNEQVAGRIEREAGRPVEVRTGKDGPDTVWREFVDGVATKIR